MGKVLERQAAGYSSHYLLRSPFTLHGLRKDAGGLFQHPAIDHV